LPKNVVEQLLIELEVESDAGQASLKSTRAATVKLADDTDKLIGMFKKGDQQFAKVAASLEKIRDRELRAKAATKAFNKAMDGQVNIFDKVADKMHVARAGLESMGAAGTALTAGLTTLAAAATAVAAAIGAAAVSSVKAFIASEEDAKAASDRLSASLNRLQVETGRLITGGDALAETMDVNAARMNALAAAVSEFNLEFSDAVIAADVVTAAFTGQIGVATRLSSNIEHVTKVLDKYIQTAERLELSREGARAGKEAAERAAGLKKFEEDLAAAQRDKFQTELEFDQKRERAAQKTAREAEQLALSKKRAGARVQAERERAFDRVLASNAAHDKLMEREAERQSENRIRHRLALQRQEEQALASSRKAEVSGILKGPGEDTDRLKKLTGEMERFNAVTEETSRASNIVQQGFSGITDSVMQMGMALAEGNTSLSELGASMLKSLGGILVKMGTALLFTGEALAGLFAGNPAMIIPASIGMIATGLLLSALSGRTSLSESGRGDGGGGEGASTANDFAGTLNNFQRNQGKEGGDTVVVYIGQHQIREPLREITESMARRGELPELRGAF